MVRLSISTHKISEYVSGNVRASYPSGLSWALMIGTQGTWSQSKHIWYSGMHIEGAVWIRHEPPPESLVMPIPSLDELMTVIGRYRRASWQARNALVHMSYHFWLHRRLLFWL